MFQSEEGLWKMTPATKYMVRNAGDAEVAC